jgi:hypothetical protein
MFWLSIESQVFLTWKWALRLFEELKSNARGVGECGYGSQLRKPQRSLNRHCLRNGMKYWFLALS